MSRDFASNWSERRRRVAEEQRDRAEAIERARHEEENAEALAAERAANREAAEAVDLDALKADSDMSVFMRDGVPDLLRKKALRALWRSDPVFSNIDRLNDYDEDFRNPKMVLTTLQSAWQAGRGYLFPEDDEDADEPRDGKPGRTIVAEADGAARATDEGGASSDPSAANAVQEGSKAEPAIGGARVHEPAAGSVALEDAAGEAVAEHREDRAELESEREAARAGRPTAPSLRSRLGV